MITLPSAVYARHPDPRVSDSYQFFSSLDITNALLDNGFELTEARANRVRSNNNESYAKHRLTFVHPRFKGNFDNELRPTFTVINSHNRTSALALALGLIRFICDNGLIRGDIVGSYKFYHTARNPVDTVMEGVFRLINEVAPTIDMISEMKVKQLSWDQQREFAVVASQVRGITTFNPSILDVQREEDNANDVWTVYNRLQENLMSGNYKIRKASKMRKARPIKGITQDFDVNTKLWNLALEYI
jgi:hypothetical protein